MWKRAYHQLACILNESRYIEPIKGSVGTNTKKQHPKKKPDWLKIRILIIFVLIELLIMPYSALNQPYFKIPYILI